MAFKRVETVLDLGPRVLDFQHFLPIRSRP
jgi:hypothetical protein